MTYADFYQEAVTSGVNDHNSISSGPDNGANNNLACAFWSSMRHSTSEMAVNNFLSRLTVPLSSASNRKSKGTFTLGVNGNCNLAGHGNDGLLTTGCGQTGSMTIHNYMMTWNKYEWGPHFSKLASKSFPLLSIWSCHTGAGEDGADFLFEIAKVVGRAVRARTGFMYSNSKCEVWFEAGSEWQLATPSFRPPAKKAPSQHIISGNIMKIRLLAGSPDLRNVTEVTVRRHTVHMSFNEVMNVEMASGGSDLAQELAQAEVFAIPGTPAAVVTAVLTVTYSKKGKSGKSGRVQQEIIVYNDRLLVASDGSTASYVGPVLRSVLKVVP